jgi:two-component system, cell cycle sensor histidine kinase and response regulator CckA
LLELFATISPRLVWITDSGGRYRYETKGWRELIGTNHHFEECIHPDDRAKRHGIRANAFRHGRPYQLQYRVKTVEGHYRWLLECAQPRHTVLGTFADMIGTCVDVTDGHDETELVRDRQRMETMGRLAGGVAHDFNNLLTIIIGYAHELRAQVSSRGDECQECLSEILAAAEVGRSITHQLLAFGGRQILKPVTLDLRLVIENLASILQQAAGEKVVLITKLEPAASLVTVDQGQLGQVLLNLVLNSKDAMPHGGTLTISTSVDGSGVVLRVTDTGIGMDKLTIDRIFEPFFTTKAFGKGTGLGLATVYGVVTQHRGSLHVESTPGKGATMTITLPRAQQTVEILQPELAPSPMLELGVLLVEDNPKVLGATRRMLANIGCTVYDANHPGAAQEVFAMHSDEIDLLVTDILMPEIDGPELAGQLRKLRPSLPVLYMSGCVEVSILDSVDTILLSKPFSPEDLVKAIKRTIALPHVPTAALDTHQSGAA